MTATPTALALFDFDGTITTHETMPAFLRRSVSRRRRLLGQCLFAPLVVGYKFGWISGRWIRSALVRYAYRGVSVSTLRAAGEAFARDELPATLRPEMMQRIAWHRAHGHEVTIVSGGLDVYLAPWCAQHQLPLLCSSLEQHEGVLTGRYQGAQCVLSEKARRVRAQHDLSRYGAIYAYGDSPEDRDLLALATHRHYRGQIIDTLPDV